MEARISRFIAEYETAPLTRRELLLAVALAGTSAGLTARSMAAQSGRQALRARTINNVGIEVSDLERSALFYQEMFGLSALRTVQSSGTEAYGLDFDARFISLNSSSSGGVITHFSIAVDDFQPGRAAEALRAAGFEVVASTSEVVIVRDPEGIHLQVTGTGYTAACPSCDPPPVAETAPARSGNSLFRARSLNHVSMAVSDLDRSVAFYQNLFDLPAARPLLPPGSGILGLDINDSYLSLSPSGARAGTITHFCIGVDDFELERDIERIRTLGLEVRELSPGQGNQTLYVNDPDGLSVQISGATWKSYCPDCDQPAGE